MLYQFLLNFVDTFGFLNVFKYITFRTGLSLFTSLAIVLIIGGSVFQNVFHFWDKYFFILKLQFFGIYIEKQLQKKDKATQHLK